MPGEYEDPPIGSRRGRVSTWIALALIALALGFFIWYSVRNWGPDDARHESFRAEPALQRLA